MARRCSSKHCLSSASVLACCLTCATLTFAQSSFQDVHIDPLSSPKAQQNLEKREIAYANAPIIRKNVDLVMVPVTVTDQMDRIVTGLDQNNFRLFDGKQQQAIKHFSSEDAPVSLGIVLDLSSSMSKKLDLARQAVTEFCKAANPMDEFFMVTFADHPELALDFTKEPDEIQRKLAFTGAKGRTALLDAVYLSLSQMRRAQYEKRALLIISDGGDNRSRYTESEIRSLVKEADVEIYSIGIFDSGSTVPEELNGPALLEDIASLTGGRAFAIDNINLLPALAVRVGAELRNQYMLAYKPDESQRNGKWHKIKIKLSVPNSLWPLLIHAKPGYYAPAH
ncbi:MAG TPA: VWA domain-containing protein [Terriglobales bacterium]